MIASNPSLFSPLCYTNLQTGRLTLSDIEISKQAGSSFKQPMAQKIRSAVAVPTARDLIVWRSYPEKGWSDSIWWLKVSRVTSDKHLTSKKQKLQFRGCPCARQPWKQSPSLHIALQPNHSKETTAKNMCGSWDTICKGWVWTLSACAETKTTATAPSWKVLVEPSHRPTSHNLTHKPHRFDGKA